MKTIKFRPLRLIKKTGKITVASYLQWNRCKTANYWGEFNLIIDEDYKKFDPDAFVYDHNGDQLFFFTYNPAEIPVFNFTQFMDLETIRAAHSQYGIRWDSNKESVSYTAKGTDCSGTPIFSHLTADYVATQYKDVTQFEPLTVKTVVFWFGWFLYTLDSAKIAGNH